MFYRNSYLIESPLEAARKAHGLDPRTAAARLNIPLLRLARLEACTRQFPPAELKRLTTGLDDSSKFFQLSLFDAMTERELISKPTRSSRKRGGLGA